MCCVVLRNCWQPFRSEPTLTRSIIFFFLIFIDPVKTEKVVNAYGSTAGANSGEFHLYRQARARELGRMETLKAAEQARQEELEYRQKVQQNQRQDEQRTAKRRKKRERQKEAKRRRQNLEKAGVLFSSEDDTAETNTNSQTNDEQSVEEDDEFDVPTAPPKALANEAEKPSTFANDGSFLEMMKRQMAEGRKVGTEKSNDAITTKSAEDTPKKD